MRRDFDFESHSNFVQLNRSEWEGATIDRLTIEEKSTTVMNIDGE